MTYEYEYVDDHAEVRRVERLYPMGLAPSELVIHQDGKPFKARLLITGGAGRMPENWGAWRKT